MKKRLTLLLGLSSLALVGVGVGLTLSKGAVGAAAAAVTPSTPSGLTDVMVQGDAPVTTSSWSTDTGVYFTETGTGTGIYDYGPVVIGDGQLIVGKKGTWDWYGNYENLDQTCTAYTGGYLENWYVHNGNSGNPNVYVNKPIKANLEYNANTNKFAINTTKTDYVDCMLVGDTTSVSWATKNEAGLFVLDEGGTTASLTVTMNAGNFKFIKWNSWTSVADFTNIDFTNSNATALAGFNTTTSPGDNNIACTTAGSYRFVYTVATGKVSIQLPAAASHTVTYYNGSTSLGTDTAYEGTNYVAKSYYVASKRFFGWYTDAAFTTPYVSASLTADTALYGKYVAAADYTIYYAPGVDWTDWGAVSIYGWHVDGTTTVEDTSAFGTTGGSSMTAMGGNVWKYTFAADKLPNFVIFSQTSNPSGNKTKDLMLNATNNFYVYQKNAFSALSDAKIEAYDAATTFLSQTSVCDATGTTDNVSSLWSSLETGLKANYSTAAITILKNNDNFLGLNSSSQPVDNIGLAVARYDYIIRKYATCSDFLSRGTGSSGAAATSQEQAELTPTLIAVISIGVAAVATAGLWISHRKHQ